MARTQGWRKVAWILVFTLLLALLLSPLLALSATPLHAQASADSDMSGTWKFKESVVFQPNDFGAKKGKATSLVHFRQEGGMLHGMACDKLGKCGLYAAPYDGTRNGACFSLQAVNAIVDTDTCSEKVGTIVSFIDGTLLDGVHATANGSGYTDFFFALEFTLTGSFTRVSGMQTADDPDGPDGPAVPLYLMGSGEPGSLGCHDLALTLLRAPTKLTLGAGKPVAVGHIKVAIQNRGQHAESIEDLAMLQALVQVGVHPLKPDIFLSDSPPATLHAPPAKAFPIVLKPRTSLKLVFDISFDAAIDPLASTKLQSHADYFVEARVRHEALAGGLPDDHAADDVAPRSVVAPYTFDSYPDGRIKERGVGTKKPDKTFGAPVLVDLVQKG